MKALRNKKALLLLWFLAVNYAFMCWAAMCGGRLFPHLTDLQTEFLLLGSVRAAAVMIFFVKPLKTHKEQHSYMRFAVILIIIIYTFWLTVANNIFEYFYYEIFKAIPHKDRLRALRHIYLQIFRHIT